MPALGALHATAASERPRSAQPVRLRQKATERGAGLGLISNGLLMHSEPRPARTAIQCEKRGNIAQRTRAAYLLPAD